MPDKDSNYVNRRETLLTADYQLHASKCPVRDPLDLADLHICNEYQTNHQPPIKLATLIQPAWSDRLDAITRNKILTCTGIARNSRHASNEIKRATLGKPTITSR
jgi:hypothetical protein